MDKVVRVMLASKATSLTSDLKEEIGGGHTDKGKTKDKVCQQRVISKEHQKHAYAREERRNELRNKYKLKGMDKFTQAMLTNKSAFLTSKLKEESDRAFDHNDHKRKTKIQNKLLKNMKEQRLCQQNEIAKAHQKSENAREKRRTEIRNKYLLKGSTDYNVGFYHNIKRDENDVRQVSKGEGELRSGSKRCSIQ